MSEFIFIAIIILAFAVILLTTNLMHEASDPLTQEMKDDIKKYGLAHYTRAENLNSILTEGIKPGKPYTRRESGLVWTFIAYPDKELKHRKDIQGKGDRKNYDAVIIIKGITDEMLSKMTCRKEKEYVVYKGILKTNDMHVVEFEKSESEIEEKDSATSEKSNTLKNS